MNDDKHIRRAGDSIAGSLAFIAIAACALYFIGLCFVWYGQLLERIATAGYAAAFICVAVFLFAISLLPAVRRRLSGVVRGLVGAACLYATVSAGYAAHYPWAQEITAKSFSAALWFTGQYFALNTLRNDLQETRGENAGMQNDNANVERMAEVPYRYAMRARDTAPERIHFKDENCLYEGSPRIEEVVPARWRLFVNVDREECGTTVKRLQGYVVDIVDGFQGINIICDEVDRAFPDHPTCVNGHVGAGTRVMVVAMK